MAEIGRNPDPVHCNVVSNRNDGTAGVRPGWRSFVMNVLRGVACALSALWLLMFHVGALSQAYFRVPFPMKMADTFMGIVATLVMLLCLRGRWKYGIGLPFAILVLWSLWLYWI